MSDPPVRDERELTADEIVKAASLLGVELDRREALQWIVAVSGAGREAFAQDAATGVFGHGGSLIDFDPDDLEYFRYLARHVRVASRPNVESAIAIAGSAAQGKAQVFPGDYDFFERVNIKAETLDAARATLRAIVRETALRAEPEPDIVLVEVTFGVYPQPVIERGTSRAAGDPITWTPSDIVGLVENRQGLRIRVCSPVPALARNRFLRPPTRAIPPMQPSPRGPAQRPARRERVGQTRRT